MSILISIASEFTGKKAFDKAEKSTKNLEKSVKSLGKTLGYTLSAAAIGAYSKAAVKAFAADEAAAQRLATAVDNLGLSYFKVDVEDFISKTQQSAAVLDDDLRPAMQALLTTTGSLTQSQKLLNDAITISRASGVELSVVAQDLANGYVGITRGLRKYNTGLTQTELKTKSFADILGVLLTRSAGAADAYLTTTAYKMEVLGVASENAKEVIGKGLVDAFALLGGGSTAADAAKTMDTIAKSIAGITTTAATAVGAIVKLYKAFDFVGSLGGLLGENGTLVNRAKPTTSTNRSASPAGTAVRTRQQRDAEAAATKRAKELASLQKKQVAATKALTAEQKKQALAKKQSALFDMEQIQIIAALKGNISKEERLRLELQLALLTGNTSEADKLSQKLANTIDQTGNLAKYLRTLPEANNPFASWDAYLTALEERIKKLNLNPPSPNGLPQTNVPNPNNFVFPDPSATPEEANRERGNFYGSGNMGVQNVTVQIDGKTIANAVVDQQMNGNNAYLNRRLNGFD
jgi:hypothetical protein